MMAEMMVDGMVVKKVDLKVAARVWKTVELKVDL